MGAILLGYGLQMATTLAQRSPVALETMVGPACRLCLGPKLLTFAIVLQLRKQ